MEGGMGADRLTGGGGNDRIIHGDFFDPVTGEVVAEIVEPQGVVDLKSANVSGTNTTSTLFKQ